MFRNKMGVETNGKICLNKIVRAQKREKKSQV